MDSIVIQVGCQRLGVEMMPTPSIQLGIKAQASDISRFAGSGVF